MNYYQVIRNDNCNPMPLIADRCDPDNYDAWKLLSGEALDSEALMPRLICTSVVPESRADDVFQNLLGVPVFSQALKDSVCTSGLDRAMQFFRADIDCADGRLLDNFYFTNITLAIDALNLDKSKYRKRNRGGKTEICGITEIVLHERAVAGHHAFRMAEFTLNLIVSQKFVDMFESNKYSGLSFDMVKMAG